MQRARTSGLVLGILHPRNSSLRFLLFQLLSYPAQVTGSQKRSEHENDDRIWDDLDFVGRSDHPSYDLQDAFPERGKLHCLWTLST